LVACSVKCMSGIGRLTLKEKGTCVSEPELVG
jgi:hypothetical protein